jgi:hypothetical protein
MSEPSNQPVPRYVVCNCKHCDGHIEFDANEFAEDNSIVPCPHCGLETKIFIPILESEEVPTELPSSVASPDAVRREGVFGETSKILQERVDGKHPAIGEPNFTDEEIKSVGKRQNDDMAVKLHHEGDQEIAMNYDDIRRYIADPRFKVMNPETGVRFTPATLEAFIESRQAQKKSENTKVELTEGQINKHWRKYNKLKAQLTDAANESKSQRVTLTSAQSEIPIVRELIALLIEIEKDSFITVLGARRLNEWLEAKNNSEIPAFRFLLETSRLVLATGELNTRTIPEIMIALELQAAIERVLPKHIREPIVAKRLAVEAQLRNNAPASQGVYEYIRRLGGKPSRGITAAEADELKEKLYHQPTEKQLEYIRALGVNPPPDLTRYTAIELIDKLIHSVKATERQLQYIRDLGGTPVAGITHGDAAEMIKQLLARQQPTPRQMMVLRFWNKTDLMQATKDEVAAWLNQFYNEDPRRKEAWELFKKENGDDGSQHDPACVPIGVGESYLSKSGTKGAEGYAKV